MFFLPFKLRESKHRVTPRGPSLRWTTRTHVDFSGTILSFRVPKHKPVRVEREPIYPERSYNLENLPLRVDFVDADADRGRKNPFRRRDIFFHSWVFCGPWFTGVLGELRFTLTLFQPVNYPQSFSLLHPRALEMVIGDYLDYRFSDHLNLSGAQNFIAPVNWQPLSQLPVNAVRLEVVPQLPSAPTRTTEHLMFFPLADDLLVLCRFEPSRFKNLPSEEMDKRVNIQPMHDLMNEIINSIQVKLSPEAQAQQAKALAGLGDTSLAKEFPPLKWDKLGEKETEAVLETQKPNVRAR
jgi:hypothetical protein